MAFDGMTSLRSSLYSNSPTEIFHHTSACEPLNPEEINDTLVYTNRIIRLYGHETNCVIGVLDDDVLCLNEKKETGANTQFVIEDLKIKKGYVLRPVINLDKIVIYDKAEQKFKLEYIRHFKKTDLKRFQRFSITASYRLGDKQFLTFRTLNNRTMAVSHESDLNSNYPVVEIQPNTDRTTIYTTIQNQFSAKRENLVIDTSQIKFTNEIKLTEVTVINNSNATVTVKLLDKVTVSDQSILTAERINKSKNKYTGSFKLGQALNLKIETEDEDAKSNKTSNSTLSELVYTINVAVTMDPLTENTFSYILMLSELSLIQITHRYSIFSKEPTLCVSDKSKYFMKDHNLPNKVLKPLFQDVLRKKAQSLDLLQEDGNGNLYIPVKDYITGKFASEKILDRRSKSIASQIASSCALDITFNKTTT